VCSAKSECVPFSSPALHLPECMAGGRDCRQERQCSAEAAEVSEGRERSEVCRGNT